MRLAIIYNPNDPKSTPQAYSWSYRDMLMAVIERFAPVKMIGEPCEAASIEADAILFWDIHSSHHIEITGIEDHPAVKLEYFNDPHQIEQKGTYGNGQTFHKLGAEQRTERAKRRGVTTIICPYRSGYQDYIAPHAGGMELAWFPTSPKPRRRSPSLLTARRPEVLANGHLWAGRDGFRPYEFRRWAFSQPGLTRAPHALNGGAPRGIMYQAFLSRYAGALALCDCYVVPKYVEIPMAGCVCFCQMLPDYAEMGFRDEVNCIAVDRDNLVERIEAFKAEPERYQEIADAGRQLVLSRYTARHFAQWLYNLIESETVTTEITEKETEGNLCDPSVLSANK